ncbi:hypothetical protein [Parablautia intestinalis]|uniref:hypothetical protein n=1 Tax=Parablautia intestinalis TaxID=2320100 RepID=UPI00256EDD24|nr:hypothetical protein [Parablautia intestinalis]
MSGKKTETEQEMKQEEKQENTMEAAGEEVKAKSWMIWVDNNPNYCGIGAGGVQFANGHAVIDSERMAAWFKEHSGYTVTEQQ